MWYRKLIVFIAFQKLMSQLEVKEKDLNKVKLDSDQLILNQHPAADKIEVIRNVFIHKIVYACINIIPGIMLND